MNENRNFDEVREMYDDLKMLIKDSYSPENLEMIDKAYKLAEAAHEGQLRKSGQPYIIHPISVAKILAQMGMDAESLTAAMLHDVVEDTEISSEDIEKMFGKDIAALVEGVTKLGKVSLSNVNKEEQQAENIRKMLIAMSHDIRVIIIKLADRLHNMRTLNFMKEQKRRDIARETLEIYAPIAHRLGIRPVKIELEDLAISYLDSVGYKEIEENLANQLTQRNEFLSDIRERIIENVAKSGINAKIDGRIKSVHGIYRKMYMQNKNFDEIYDIYAVRIIVDSVIDCYNCLGIIHDMFRPLPGRFKDYISTPKPNMYQSLHTTVISKEGVPFEVQIRTWEMHHTAEYGIAAHWKYKLNMGGGTKSFDERLAWVRQLLESQDDAGSVDEIVSTIKSDLVVDDVYVFTPKGDVINLPLGATVIDFAYAIHSAVGNKMTGAKVDGRIVPIDYKVQTGEIVDIITSSQQGKGPSRDWLNIVKTSEARSKIRSWFKKERREENIEQGREQLEREFRRALIRLPDEEHDAFMNKLAERQRCKTIEDFYAAIGYGGISLNKIMPRIKDDYSKLISSKQIKPPVEAPKKRIKSSEGVVVEGIDNCLVKFAHCCNPLPGDKIIGFITRGHGVSIHSRNCTNVPEIIEEAAEPYRWLNAYWDKGVKEEYNANLLITGFDRIGLLADISVMLSSIRVLITNINSRSLKDGTFIMSCTIFVDGIEHLKSVISKIEKIDGVLKVERK
ncbi:MAG: bifunctional (p)ppGpp synthetase/guanosine-3',5'-bis(diphosphate) 3'-pyrophosphohydrolase [Clostridia bacterium]|nr:bifunctional (p)ppGpp synthetase/guanosine-3',5'-bis(diphosphate) 3'-pyrophosphohydrolase [Clostridia bacterium]MBR6620534.1 bifunctional (p)ppGpp synthetase/guanosine-3',5'-bis(diphosphate) 3'-pyrophosphohydrolase [Clostridia bacterium]